MNGRSWGRILAGAVLVAGAVAAGPAASASPGPHQPTGTDVAHASAAKTAAGTAAGTIVPLPDLGIAHRLAGGGMNLWRMPLSDLDTGTGQPQLVKTLDYGGFSYDRSVTLTGDFGDVTPSDDGTADHVIWHAQPNGGVLVWGVGGGGDPTPQLWQDLRTGGWSWALSRPTVGDVNGDGWDDLVVEHQIPGTNSENIWVLYSDGQKLGAPQFLFTDTIGWYGYAGGSPGNADRTRALVTDLNGDGIGDMLIVNKWVWHHDYDLNYVGYTSHSPSTPFDGRGYLDTDLVFSGSPSAGWSFANSRQLVGDVTGDGMPDIVTVHAQAGGGMLVWVSENCTVPGSFTLCFDPPQVWQNLKTGGWSFAGSRQYLADTNGDGVDDLVSVHSQAGGPGELVWRALSTGSSFATPQVLADLKTGGWTYAASREGVADLYGTGP